jgi:hypothetical protein
LYEIGVFKVWLFRCWVLRFFEFLNKSKMNKKILFLLSALTVAFWISSCQKSETASPAPRNFREDSTLAFSNYEVAGIPNKVSINYPNIMVQFPDSVVAPGNLVASFTLFANGDQATILGTKQISGVNFNNFDYPFIYTIKNSGNDSSQWEVIETNNNYTLDWGLGQWLQLSHSNDRDYNWYIDQSSTGTCWQSNCGPSCATMAMMWADSTFTHTVEDARIYSKDSCQDWNNNFITGYLSTDNIPNRLIPLGDNASQMRDFFKAYLDSGMLLIVNLYTGSLPFPISQGANNRVDQFYNGFADPHFIILKGYRQTEMGFFFEVCDPFDLGETYPDGPPKGEDRFYHYEDIFNAIMANGGGTQIAVSRKW